MYWHIRKIVDITSKGFDAPKTWGRHIHAIIRFLFWFNYIPDIFLKLIERIYFPGLRLTIEKVLNGGFTLWSEFKSDRILFKRCIYVSGWDLVIIAFKVQFVFIVMPNFSIQPLRRNLGSVLVKHCAGPSCYFEESLLGRRSLDHFIVLLFKILLGHEVEWLVLVWRPYRIEPGWCFHCLYCWVNTHVFAAAYNGAPVYHNLSLDLVP